MAKFALPIGWPFVYDKNMRKSITVRQKKRGRPATGHDPAISIRLPPELIAAVDRWAGQNEATRSEAIRRLVEASLQILAKNPDQKPARKAGTRAGRASKASELAGKAIDRLGDKSAPVEERERRKRRLIKGPQEFRDVRGDLPKLKG